MKNIVVIGGDNEKGYKQKLDKTNITVKYHNGKLKQKGTRNILLHLLKDVECVIIIVTAISHGTMYTVKEIAKELNIQVIYQKSKGISGLVKTIHENVAF